MNGILFVIIFSLVYNPCLHREQVFFNGIQHIPLIFLFSCFDLSFNLVTKEQLSKVTSTLHNFPLDAVIDGDMKPQDPRKGRGGGYFGVLTFPL